jgi:uncharacterized membrane protein SpoIIM required for sporulation
LTSINDLPLGSQIFTVFADWNIILTIKTDVYYYKDSYTNTYHGRQLSIEEGITEKVSSSNLFHNWLIKDFNYCTVTV